LGLSARAVLMWCDELIVSDHWSTDDSSKIYWKVREEHPNRVHIIEHRDHEWTEMDQRQCLLNEARERGATHIALVDADEILAASLLPSIRDDILQTNPRAIFQLPWIQLRGGITEYHSSGIWSEQNVSFAFVDRPEYHWAQRDGYDFHHRHPMGPQMLPFRPIPRKRGGLLHLQMCSERRLRAKQCLYLMTEVIRWPGRMPLDKLQAMYNLAVYGQAEPTRDWAMKIITVMPFSLAKCPPEWWAPYSHLMKYLNIHAEPWQEAECKRLWAEYGPEKFQGLDLYGVVGL
jgi:hypothetical protein